MQMTHEEFNKIRPLQWNLINLGNKTYNTVSNSIGTRLFWIDFFRHVFAPYFAKQKGITRLTYFDLTRPVLLTNDLKLELPTDVATILYYAKNTQVPIKFSTNISQNVAMWVTITTIIIIVVFATVLQKKFNFDDVI